MWISLQQDKPDDYILATGDTISIKDFCIKVFNQLGINLEFKGEGINEKAFDKSTGKTVIEINPEFVRKAENTAPRGNCTKAQKILNWKPTLNIDDLVKEMVEEDYKIESGKN